MVENKEKNNIDKDGKNIKIIRVFGHESIIELYSEYVAHKILETINNQKSNV